MNPELKALREEPYPIFVKNEKLFSKHYEAALLLRGTVKAHEAHINFLMYAVNVALHDYAHSFHDLMAPAFHYRGGYLSYCLLENIYPFLVKLLENQGYITTARLTEVLQKVEALDMELAKERAVQELIMECLPLTEVRKFVISEEVQEFIFGKFVQYYTQLVNETVQKAEAERRAWESNRLNP